MATLSICAMTNFFSNKPKSIERGENHFNSGHVLSYSYSDGILRGSVQASMKNKSYKVTVSEVTKYIREGTHAITKI